MSEPSKGFYPLLDNPFEYRAPTPSQVALMKHYSHLLGVIYGDLTSALPPGPERTLAIRKLQEARMWINVAVLGADSEKGAGI
jgi:hypothetical protein